MKKALLALAVVVAIAVVAIWWFLLRGPDLSTYEPLVDPRITSMPDTPVIQVEARGDPNETGSDAFGLLFQTYFALDGVPKGPGQPAPRARWPVDAGDDPSDWIGLYAMPVPQSVTALPVDSGDAAEGLHAEITIWRYGQVAEILHKGSYDSETPTIERLKAFIADSGYEIAGLHEEEYLRGPGTLLPVDPDDYYTIIRYRVRKAGAGE